MRAAIWITGCVAVAAGTALWAWLASARAEVGDPPILSDPALGDPKVAERAAHLISAIRTAPRQASVRADLAMLYHANGMPAMAQPAYEQALTLNSREPRWWYGLAHVRADQGEMDGAIAATERAIALDSAYGPGHWQSGYWLLDLDRLDMAEKAFSKARSINRNDPAALVGLARVALVRKDFSQAAALLREAIQANPKDPNVAYMGQLHGFAERSAGTRGILASLSHAKGLEPQWRDPWLEQIMSSRLGYRAMIEHADRLITKGLAPQAIATLQALLRERPKDINVLNYLADAHFALAQWDQGIKALQTALAAEPDRFVTHLNLSEGYEGKGDLPAALNYAKRAAELNPGLGPAHLQIGRILLKQNQSADAIVPLTKALNTGLSDPNVRVTLGHVHLQLQNWRDAERLFDQARQMNPQLASAYVGLAGAKAELGAVQEAASLLQIAQRIDPSDPNLLKTLARVSQLQASAQPAAR